MIDTARDNPSRTSAADWAMLAAVTGTLALALSISVGHVTATATLILLATNWASAILGNALLNIASSGRTSAETWPVCWLAGMLSLSLFILAASLIFQLSAGTALIIAIVVCGLLALRRGRTRQFSPSRNIELVSVVLACAATLAWSWRAVESAPGLRETGVFNAWSDYFIHAGEITQFASLPALHGHSIFAAGAPLPLYHYASYMLPAALACLANLSALTCATALWTPLGFLALGFGAFALGQELAGRAGGLAAVASVLLLPDASWYGLRNPFCDFHWLLQISSSGAFAVGLALLSAAFLHAWMTGGRRMHWVAAVTSAVLVAPFRVHIAVLLLPVVVLMSLCYWKAPKLWRIAGGGSAAGLAVIAAVIANSIPRAPHFFSDPIQPLAFLKFLHSMRPSSYSNVFHIAVTHLPTWLSLVFGVLLLMLAAFGALLPLYLILLCIVRRRGDSTPGVAVLGYAAIVLVFPVTPEEPYEFQHRPFVLVYALLAVWCGAMLVRWISSRTQGGMDPLWLTFPILLFLPFPVMLSPWAQQSRLEWGTKYAWVAVPQDLQQVAAAIRHVSRRDAVMVIPESKLAPAFAALCERAIFFPSADFLRIQSGLDERALDVRKQTQEALLGDRSVSDFWRTACKSGINIVATLPNTRLAPTILATANIRAGNYSAIFENQCSGRR